MPIRSLLVQHDHSRGSSWVNGGRKCPGGAGAKVGCVSIGNDVSQIGHVSGVLGPDGVGGDKREGSGKSRSEQRLRAREAASSSQGSSCCRALSARVLVRMDGWMDGWVGDQIATVDTSSRVS